MTEAMIHSPLQGRNTQSTNRRFVRGVYSLSNAEGLRERLVNLAYIFSDKKVSALIDGHKMLQRIATIQRYEAGGVDPTRTMIINGLAEALLTTPEWLTGLSEEKEYSTRTICEKTMEEHTKKFLDVLTSTVQGEPRQEMLTNILGQYMDMYAVLCGHFARAMAEADRIAEDEGLKQSLMKYAIGAGEITEKAYHNELSEPVEDMKQMVDCFLHIYDLNTKNVFGKMSQIKMSAEERLADRNNNVAP